MSGKLHVLVMWIFPKYQYLRTGHGRDEYTTPTFGSTWRKCLKKILTPGIVPFPGTEFFYEILNKINFFNFFILFFFDQKSDFFSSKIRLFSIFFHQIHQIWSKNIFHEHDSLNFDGNPHKTLENDGFYLKIVHFFKKIRLAAGPLPGVTLRRWACLRRPAARGLKSMNIM